MIPFFFHHVKPFIPRVLSYRENHPAIRSLESTNHEPLSLFMAVAPPRMILALAEAVTLTKLPSIRLFPSSPCSPALHSSGSPLFLSLPSTVPLTLRQSSSQWARVFDHKHDFNEFSNKHRARSLPFVFLNSESDQRTLPDMSTWKVSIYIR